MTSQGDEFVWYKALSKHLLAGGAAGAVSRTVVSPLERVKILMQLQGNHLGKQHHQNYSGVVGSLRRIYQKEGLKGYYRGNASNVIRIVPYSAVQFAVYEQMKIYFGSESGQLEYWPRFLCGAAAGVASVVVTYPLDLVRTRMSASMELFGNTRKYQGIIQTTRIVAKQEGIAALYKGMGPTVAGVAPYVGLNFSLHETFKHWFMDREEDHKLTFSARVASSGLAGAIAQTSTYPLDLLRRKMQMQGASEHYPVYGSTWRCIKHIWAHDGIKGFYRGVVPNYLKVVPSVSAAFITFDVMSAQLRAHRIV